MHAYPPSSWKALFPYLDAWRALSLPQRAAALHVQPVYQQLPDPLLHLPPAIRESLFEAESPKSAARQTASRSASTETHLPRHRPTSGFRKLISLFERFSTWSGREGPNLLLYVQQTTTDPQRLALTRVPPGTPTEAMAAAFQRRMIDGAFTRTLLEKETAIGFLEAVNHWTPEGLELTEDRYHILRAWVRGAVRNRRSGFALREDAFRVPGSKVPPEELLVLLSSYGIAFLGFYPASLDPVIQIMLPVEKAAQGPEHIEILSHPGGPAFERPFLLDDMDSILRTAKEDPIPLLTDGINVPVARLRRLGKEFLPLPKMLDLAGFEEEHRAQAAWWMIGAFELVTGQGRGRKDYKAHLNARGEDWLRLPREKKLEHVLIEAPMGRRKKHNLGARFSWLGEHVVHPFPYAALNSGVMEALEKAVERLADVVPGGGDDGGARDHRGGWADFAALIRSVALKANPFIADKDRDARLDGLWARWDERPETVYVRLTQHHLARLASLGAVAFSQERGDTLGVTLTDIGRWLYARSDNWAMPPRGRPVAVVGADHHVVFTEADPNLETDLRPFTEPVGETGGPGATFRLTRKSVQEGLHRGLRLEDMLAILEAGSKTPLPKNVLHEVRSWAGAKKNLALRDTILVECDDPLVIAEVLSTFPRDFERISPTALAHIGDSTRQALARRLAKKGFFS